MDIQEAKNRLDKIRTDEKERAGVFTVAFSGVFSSGKSSVLNYLMDYGDFMLPVGDFPITKVVTRIQYGNSLKFYCFANNQQKKTKISREKFENIVIGKEKLPKGCREIMIEIPAAILKDGVVFVDTPGFLDEMGGELEKMSREAVLKSDLVIFCTSAVSLGHQFEREYIEELEESIGNFCMIVNHMDCCNTEEDRETIEDKAAFLMKDKGGQYLGNLFGRNYFFTVAAGAGRTLNGFDSYIAYALGDMRLRERIKQSSVKKIEAFRRKMLALDAEVELAALKEQYEDAAKQHKRRKSEIETQNRMAALNNERERTKLIGVYMAQLGEAAEQAESGIKALNADAFVQRAREVIKESYLPVAKIADSKLKLTGQNALTERFNQKISSFQITKPEQVVIRRRGFLERVVGAVENMITLETLDLDLIIDPECVYGYSDYKSPTVSDMKSNLYPKLLQCLQSAVNEYSPEKSVAPQTGLEQHLGNLEQKIAAWEEVIRKCLENEGKEEEPI